MTVDMQTQQPSVLSKARQILDAFLAEDLGVTAVLPLSELARRSGVPKASVHRLAQELVEWGLLERERPSGGYRLGMLLFEMGQRVSRQRVLRDAALPHMEALLETTGETVHLAIADGTDVLYVDKLPGRRPVAEPSQVAGRLPLHATATGKVLLAFGPRRTVDALVQEGLARITPRTTATPGLLAAQLARVRQERLAVEVEETRLGHASIAVPVSDGGAVIAALSVTAPTARGPLLRHAAALRAAALGTSRGMAAARAVAG